MKKLLFALIAFNSLVIFAQNYPDFEVHVVTSRIYKNFGYVQNPQLLDGCPLLLVATYAENKKKNEKNIIKSEIFNLDLAKITDRCFYRAPDEINGFFDSVFTLKP